MIWKIDTSVATHTAVASDTIVIVAGIIIAKIGSIVVVAEMNYRHRGVMKMLNSSQISPFVDSRLGAGPGSFFSFPSFSYGYQNRACFDIL